MKARVLQVEEATFGQLEDVPLECGYQQNDEALAGEEQLSEVLEPNLADEGWYELNDPGYAQKDGQLEAPEEALPEGGLVGQLGLAGDPVKFGQRLGEEDHVDQQNETTWNRSPDHDRHQLTQTTHNLAIHGLHREVGFDQVVDTDRDAHQHRRRQPRVSAVLNEQRCPLVIA